MLLAALRGSAHVSALSSVVLPRLLHRSSATAATSLLTRHRHRCCCCYSSSFAGVRDVAGPEQCKVGTGGSRRRRVMQRRTNNIRSGAAERRTLAGGETLRRRSRREPSAVPSFAPRHTLLLLLPGHITLHWGWRVCVCVSPTTPGKGGHSSSINALIEPVCRHRGTGRSVSVSASASLRLVTPEVAGGN